MSTITTWGPSNFYIDKWHIGWAVTIPCGQPHQIQRCGHNLLNLFPVKLASSEGTYICDESVRLIHIESPSDPPCDTENG